MAIQPKLAFQGSSCFHSHLYSSSPSILARRFQSLGPYPSRRSLKLNSSSNGNNGEQDYLLDAPVSVGDGFSFNGGKYSDEPSPSDEWFKQGKMFCVESGSADNPSVILIHGFPSQD